MTMFESYPQGGRVLLGRPRNTTGATRTGYGLGLQRLTGQTKCAYCGVSLTDDYYHWLLMSVDHVVPRGEAQRVGIDPRYFEDVINLVLCCAGCNGFGNRYRCDIEARPDWTLEEFVALRDRVFEDRAQSISTRRGAERAFFASKPWELQIPVPGTPATPQQPAISVIPA